MRVRHIGFAFGSLLVAVALAACSVSVGGSDEIDHAKAEKLLRENVRPTPKSVTCPSGVKIVKGGTFACHITLPDGNKGSVTIHMTDDTGDIHVGNADIHIRD
ncbi:MAG TPA: DUF4333 domain-containing protein [Gaiellaceae bacterium]|jgi:hypothetical protein